MGKCICLVDTMSFNGKRMEMIIWVLLFLDICRKNQFLIVQILPQVYLFSCVCELCFVCNLFDEMFMKELQSHILKVNNAHNHFATKNKDTFILIQF